MKRILCLVATLVFCSQSAAQCSQGQCQAKQSAAYTVAPIVIVRPLTFLERIRERRAARLADRAAYLQELQSRRPIVGVFLLPMTGGACGR